MYVELRRDCLLFSRTVQESVGHQGGNDKCATDAKLRGREDITIATWNVKTLRAAGKVEELLHDMDRYKWSILGLCEMRWTKSGEIPTDGVTECISVEKRTNMNKEWVS